MNRPELNGGNKNFQVDCINQCGRNNNNTGILAIHNQQQCFDISFNAKSPTNDMQIRNLCVYFLFALLPLAEQGKYVFNRRNYFA